MQGLESRAVLSLILLALRFAFLRAQHAEIGDGLILSDPLRSQPALRGCGPSLGCLEAHNLTVAGGRAFNCFLEAVSARCL